MNARPWPVSTAFWIGETVYKKHGGKDAGTIVGLSIEGDAERPSIQYNVSWPKANATEYSYAMELTTEAPPKFKT